MLSIILSISLGALVISIFLFLSSQTPQTDKDRFYEKLTEVKEKLNKKEENIQHLKEMITIKKQRIQSLIDQYATYKDEYPKLALEKDWWNKKKVQLVSVNLPTDTLFNIAESDRKQTEQILDSLYGEEGHPEDRFALEQLLHLEMESRTPSISEPQGLEVDLSDILTDEELAPFEENNKNHLASETTTMPLPTSEMGPELESQHQEHERIFQSNDWSNHHNPFTNEDTSLQESNSDMIRDEMEKGDVNGMGHHLHDEQNKPYEHEPDDPFPYEEPPTRFTMADFDVTDDHVSVEDFQYEYLEESNYEDSYDTEPYDDPHNFDYDDYGDENY